jgi:hypothetical protein
MREARQLVVVPALAMAAALLCSGCLAMMVPGLAYSGYKYEHDKNQPPATASNSSTQGSKSASASQQRTPDDSIE